MDKELLRKLRAWDLTITYSNDTAETASALAHVCQNLREIIDALALTEARVETNAAHGNEYIASLSFSRGDFLRRSPAACIEDRMLQFRLMVEGDLSALGWTT